jgi:hypothetical protein
MGIETYLNALYPGLSLRYRMWESNLIWARYGNSNLMTHSDTFLTLYENHKIRLFIHNILNESGVIMIIWSDFNII